MVDEQDPEDLRLMRGILFGLLFSIPIWLIIGGISYLIYRLLRGW